MVKTLREAKARLSQLVRAAGRGEETLITVRGKITAKIAPAGRVLSAAEHKKWADELRELRRRYTTPKGRKMDSQKLWDELRADRF
jgi:prevent-host-death family protein